MLILHFPTLHEEKGKHMFLKKTAESYSVTVQERIFDHKQTPFKNIKCT